MPRFRPMMPTVTLRLGNASACANSGPDARAMADPADTPRNSRREGGGVTAALLGLARGEWEGRDPPGDRVERSARMSRAGRLSTSVGRESRDSSGLHQTSDDAKSLDAGIAPDD